MKKAFTLAEVLITLAIIGVVAAMTIPTLISKYQKNETITKLKKIYSTLSQATQMAIIDNGDISTWDIETLGYENSANFSEKYLEPYIKVTKKCGLNDDSGECHFSSTGLDGSSNLDYYSRRCTKLFLNDGSVVMPCPHKQYGVVLIFVDINGLKGPNIIGKDIYGFDYTITAGSSAIKNKFLPRYFQMTIEELTADVTYMCNKNQSGDACSALIYKQGWKITEDYPW